MPRRHLLSIADLSPEEVLAICQRALRIKRSGRSYPRTLRGRTVGVYFRKSSTRTRTSFLAGAGRLGAGTVAFGPDDLQTTTGESLEDTARVLAGYLDVLVIRTNDTIDEMRTLAAQGDMCVINALSDCEHPTQAVADLTTMLESFGRLEGLSVLYCGEGNKTAASLALAISRVRGMRLTLATPSGYGLRADTLHVARRLADVHGAFIEEVHDARLAPVGVDVVYTSRWQEMGVRKPEPGWKQRFAPFGVTEAFMKRVSGPATIFMHDLPAQRGEDVASEVLDGQRSLAWVQAQHKMFSAMAILEWCAADAGVPQRGR